jgi:hypothetical protein
MIISFIKDCTIFSLINIGYFGYLELNPKTKGIVFRPNEKNEKVLSINSITYFMRYPFTPMGFKVMWHPNNWNINYPVVMILSFGFYKYIL